MTIWRTENALITWGKEVSPPNINAPYGTPVVPDHRFGIHDTCEAPDPDIAWTNYWGVGPNAGRSRNNVFRGRWSLRGSVPNITVQQGQSLADLLSLGLGRTSGLTVLEGISATDGRLPSFTMQIAARDTDGNYTFARSYIGGKINRMTIGASEGEALMVSLDDIIFKDMVHNVVGVPHQAGGTLSIGNDPGIIPGKGRFLFAGATITLFNTIYCRVKRFQLTLDNQLDAKYYLCKSATDPLATGSMTQVLSDLVEGKRIYQLDVDLDLVDSAGLPGNDLQLWNFMLTQAPQGGTWTMNFDVAPGEGSGTLQIQGSLGASTSRPGSVITRGKINLPPPPAGYFAQSFSINVDSVQFTVPA